MTIHKDGCENIFSQLRFLGGNNRDFGSLQFRRILKRLILGGGHKIPGTPVALADAAEPQEPVFSEPLLSMEVTDGLWNDENEAPVQTIDFDPKETLKPVDKANEQDFLFDDVAPDVQMHIVGAEGFIYHTGWLARGSKKFSKQLSESQSLPTSKLEEFENFESSEWLDMRNKAWTGKYM